MKKEIYLGKSGKVFGPFTSQEFELLQAKDEFSTFHWIWDWQQEGWKPLEAPPPSPFAQTSAHHSTAHSASTSINWQQIEAICYDRFRVLSGKLQAVTETGCQFILRSGGQEGHKHDGMALPEKGPAYLSLYDPSGKARKAKSALEVPVRIAGIEFSNEGWIYRLRWAAIPGVR